MIESWEGRFLLMFNRADARSTTPGVRPHLRADVYLDSALKSADIGPLVAAAVQMPEDKKRRRKKMRGVGEGVAVLPDPK